jgi:hypothetical protein
MPKKFKGTAVDVCDFLLLGLSQVGAQWLVFVTADLYMCELCVKGYIGHVRVIAGPYGHQLCNKGTAVDVCGSSLLQVLAVQPPHVC